MAAGGWCGQVSARVAFRAACAPCPPQLPSCWVRVGCWCLRYPQCPPAVGTAGWAPAAWHAGDSRGCHGAVPASSACGQEPVAGRGGALSVLLLLSGWKSPSLRSCLPEVGDGRAGGTVCQPVDVPLCATSSGAAGNLRCPSNRPPLANHLLAKLVINSFSSSLGKPGWASTRCSQVPCQRDVLRTVATTALAITTTALG